MENTNDESFPINHNEEPLGKRKWEKKLANNIHNGFSYVYSSSSGNVMKVTCKHTRRPSRGYPPCPGKANIIDGQYEVTRDHNHPPFELAAKVKRFRLDLEASAKISSDRNRNLFDACIKKHPDVSHIAYNRVDRTMRRHKAMVNPPPPHSLEEFGNYLTKHPWTALLSYPKGQLTAKVLRDTDGYVAVVFSDRGFIETILPYIESGQSLFSDATFECFPSNLNIRQLLEIQVCSFDHGLAIAHALMEKKSEAAYTVVYKYIFEELAPELAENIVVHMDFEVAESNGLMEVVPSASIQRCQFHFDQAVRRNVYKHKALKRERKRKNGTDHPNIDEREKKINDEVLKILILLLALAFLPAKHIPAMFGRIQMLIIDEDVKKRMANFLEYFQKQWLNRCPPEEWSVYRASRRTNNAAESWNRTLNQKFGYHPLPWEFARKLADIQNRVRSDYDAIIKGETRYTCRWTDEVKENKLRKFERRLHRRRFTPWEFLTQAANLVNFEKRKVVKMDLVFKSLISHSLFRV